jgi:hypothetical protein
VALVLFGLVSATLAMIAPDRWLRALAPAAAGWTAERATEHQARSLELHQRSLAGSADQRSQERLREARLRFAETESALRDAAEGGGRVRGRLRIAGGALVGLGCVLIAVGRSAD